MKKLELYDNYLREKITKHQYIWEIFKEHQSLFEYSEFLKNSDIKSIKNIKVTYVRLNLY